jgi:hypothetical protein
MERKLQTSNSKFQRAIENSEAARALAAAEKAGLRTKSTKGDKSNY